MLLCLDLSLNSTGYCIGEGDHIHATGVICPSKCLSQYKRVQSNLSAIRTLISKYNIHTVAIEEQAHGKKSSSTKILGEQQGVIKYAIWCDPAVSVAGVAITLWKKHLTGNGSASKELIASTLKDLGYECETQDEYDAIGIYKYVSSIESIPIVV